MGRFTDSSSASDDSEGETFDVRSLAKQEALSKGLIWDDEISSCAINDYQVFTVFIIIFYFFFYFFLNLKTHFFIFLELPSRIQTSWDGTETLRRCTVLQVSGS